ncbi:uncharacterized protein BP5553_06166 [Venustampulla echinocandica]|uniref:Fungal lipase-type domain-containing protein n=1 Tax=Venustampulla echinocandica TaxID=2656787 RepID=A0A370TMS3_9HELO|nr:uncharacterized protein BP5553_06166 [Venustampulla echinocandica]RDL36814.1 hypothetical protein BP5553_06166 [Venustampulla echinocandica]
MLRLHASFVTLTILFSLGLSTVLHPSQRPLSFTHPPDPLNTTIHLPLFADLEFLSRLVDISYCVGTSGIYHPFKCLSRCDQFPTFELIDTFNTGPLLSDSCGYVAISHGGEQGMGNRNGKEWKSGDGGNGRIVVAFRGTYSLANTIADLSSVPQEYIPYPGEPGGDDEQRQSAPDSELPTETSSTGKEKKCNNCTVHTGFWTSWENTRPYVIPRLKNLRASYPDYRLDLVGHSLGGAVAALAGLEVEALGWQPVVTTFGEPRVGNVGLRDYVDDVFGLLGEQGKEGTGNLGGKYRRVTHVNDPVPLLPLSEWGYRPHAGEIYISKLQLQPELDDVRFCVGDEDTECIAGAEVDAVRDAERLRLMVRDVEGIKAEDAVSDMRWHFPARYKMWELFFSHRDYFWRLGLCVPGGDPLDWGRGPYGERKGEL